MVLWKDLQNKGSKLFHTVWFPLEAEMLKRQSSSALSVTNPLGLGKGWEALLGEEQDWWITASSRVCSYWKNDQQAVFWTLQHQRTWFGVICWSDNRIEPSLLSDGTYPAHRPSSAWRLRKKNGTNCQLLCNLTDRFVQMPTEGAVRFGMWELLPAQSCCSWPWHSWHSWSRHSAWHCWHSWLCWAESRAAHPSEQH